MEILFKVESTIRILAAWIEYKDVSHYQHRGKENSGKTPVPGVSIIKDH